MTDAVRRTRGRGDLNELKLRRYIHDTEAVRGIVRFDTFTGKPILHRPIPRPMLAIDNHFVPRPLQDHDITAMMEHLQGVKFDKVKRLTVDHSLMLEAHSNAFSAARERFEALPAWDGKERLDEFLIDILGLKDETKFDYYKRVSRFFINSIVVRVMEPGSKVDTLLVLEGPQGAYKSRVLRILALDDGWFSDSLPHNLSSKDAKQHLQGKLIVEMAEIAQMDRTSDEALKAFLSAQDDKFRPPYGRHEVARPRQNVFVGTTNDNQYLRDITGNRRYWPIECGEIDLEYAKREISQVYAEALHAYRQSRRAFRWWFHNGEEAMAQFEQARRLRSDPWEDLARVKLAEKERTAAANNQLHVEVVVSDILFDWFRVPTEKQDGKLNDRVGKLLKSLGGRQVRPMIDGVRKRCVRFTIGDIGRGGDAE